MRSPKCEFRSATWRRAKSWVAGLFIGLLLGCGDGGDAHDLMPPEGAGSPFWLRYGLDRPHPRSERAARVFDTLRAVADENRQRPPHLLIVDVGAANPWALSLRDGGVVLSVQALDLCYGDGDDAAGDSRLGFVLAHELAHLASQHFQHVGAYFAVQKTPDGERRNGLAEILSISPETLRGRELLADQRALVYLTLAGFDPGPVLGGEHFFESWTSQAIGEVAYGGQTHPTARERARFLKDSLLETVQRLPLFDWGVRLYQIHRFDDAIDFLAEFKTVFAGPAVLNDLGLAHLQKALRRAVVECPDEFFRLRLPSPVVDPDTLARRLILRGSGESCLKDDPDLKEAIGLLEEASQFPDYGSHSGLNHCAALVAAREAREAYSCAGELRERQHSSEAELLEIQAEYLLWTQGTPLDSDSLLESIATLAARERDSALVAFNHASIVESIGDSATARPFWRRFLELEPGGPYADHARRRLGEASPPVPRTPAPSLPDEMWPPIPPGVPAKEPRARLGDLPAGPEFELLRGSWRPYRDGPWRILYRLPQASEPGRVVLVERDAPALWSSDQLLSRHGPPVHSVKDRRGEFLRYPGFGFQMQDGHAKVVVFF